MNALIAYLKEHDSPCPGCGYNLRGVEAEVCPECSRAVRLRELQRAEEHRTWRAARLPTDCAGVAGVIGALLGAAWIGAMLVVAKIGLDLLPWSRVTIYTLGAAVVIEVALAAALSYPGRGRWRVVACTAAWLMPWVAAAAVVILKGLMGA
jgi:hypothetical protein